MKTQTNHTFCSGHGWRLFALCVCVVFVAMLPSLAFATDTLGAILCAILRAMRSQTFRAIATLGIIIVGIGALLGKVSWGMAIMVVLGVVLIFGASDIIDGTIEQEGLDTGSGCYDEEAAETTPDADKKNKFNKRLAAD